MGVELELLSFHSLLHFAGCVFFEIVSLYPLFPGTNELDQIHKIHNILGTPSPDLLNKMKKYAVILEHQQFVSAGARGYVNFLTLKLLVYHAGGVCGYVVTFVVPIPLHDKIVSASNKWTRHVAVISGRILTIQRKDGWKYAASCVCNVVNPIDRIQFHPESTAGDLHPYCSLSSPRTTYRIDRDCVCRDGACGASMSMVQGLKSKMVFQAHRVRPCAWNVCRSHANVHNYSAGIHPTSSSSFPKRQERVWSS